MFHSLTDLDVLNVKIDLSEFSEPCLFPSGKKIFMKPRRSLAHSGWIDGWLHRVMFFQYLRRSQTSESDSIAQTTIYTFAEYLHFHECEWSFETKTQIEVKLLISNHRDQHQFLNHNLSTFRCRYNVDWLWIRRWPWRLYPAPPPSKSNASIRL